MRRLIARVFEFFQRRCTHRPAWVRADILEGCHDREGMNVQWCLRCGAYRVTYQHERDTQVLPMWREPRATWASEANR